MNNQPELRGTLLRIAEDILSIGVLGVMAAALIFMIIAMADKNNKGEAPIGSFAVREFNQGWRLQGEGLNAQVELPARFDPAVGEVFLVNELPPDIGDGMSLMARGSMEDVLIYVDGELRAEYSTASLRGISYYIPSAYISVALSDKDAGKEIKLLIRPKNRGILNEITLAYGNNAWFPILASGLWVNLIAAVVLILGVMINIAVFFLGRHYQVSAIRFLGLLMVDISLWMLSESTLRQLFYRRPSLSLYFSYLTVELISVLTCMYFDEVQHRVYHARYRIAEGFAFTQLVVNLSLHVGGIRELHETLIFSHIWAGVAAATAIVAVFQDIRAKRTEEYRVTLFGMISFVLLALAELAGFYLNRSHQFGSFICGGMLILMGTTLLQAILDETKARELHERTQTEMTVSSIQTIASAIDARDEYTGGHSERVGFYAERLAREMAADYDLSEEDILRVHYIGLLHDIGKIGVADNVLNKPGRLTEEEFSLMKKHTEIGFEIMSALGENIPGLLEGIRHHHERFDGKGYPDGLSDIDIPLIARVLALADSYDAMTSNRVYRKSLSDKEVREEIRRCSGTQFDPALTEIFVRLLDKGELKIRTVDGVAADEEGKAYVSALLESRLQKDLREGAHILNPSHVRMLCYIIKLMEKKGKSYRLLFLSMDNEAAPENRLTPDSQSLRALLGRHDVCISYTDEKKIIALFDRTNDEAEEFARSLKAAFPAAAVTGVG